MTMRWWRLAAALTGLIVLLVLLDRLGVFPLGVGISMILGLTVFNVVWRWRAWRSEQKVRTALARRNASPR